MPHTDMRSSESVRIALDVGLVVADLEQSLSFYHDLVGLPIVGELNTSLVGRGRMVQLSYGESLIKLIQLETNPNPSYKGVSAALGIRYITLLVADIETVMGRLEQAGTIISTPMTQLGNGALIAMVEDPDGNTVEFVQEATSLWG